MYALISAHWALSHENLSILGFLMDLAMIKPADYSLNFKFLAYSKLSYNHSFRSVNNKGDDQNALCAGWCLHAFVVGMQQSQLGFLAMILVFQRSSDFQLLLW